MIRLINTNKPESGIKALADEMISVLKKGKRVLWLVSGGSNIPIAVRVMNMIRTNSLADEGLSESESTLSNLTVALTDERYGLVGHADSNWKQLEDAGFNFDGVNKITVLKGKPLEETVSDYEKNIRKATDETLADGGSIIGQFGIGTDGHIASFASNRKLQRIFSSSCTSCLWL